MIREDLFAMDSKILPEILLKPDGGQPIGSVALFT